MPRTEREQSERFSPIKGRPRRSHLDINMIKSEPVDEPEIPRLQFEQLRIQDRPRSETLLSVDGEREPSTRGGDHSPQLDQPQPNNGRARSKTLSSSDGNGSPSPVRDEIKCEGQVLYVLEQPSKEEDEPIPNPKLNVAPSVVCGANRKGDMYCRHPFATDPVSEHGFIAISPEGSNGWKRPYHYVNAETTRTVYFANPDRSTYTYYHPSPPHYFPPRSRYTSPDGVVTIQINPDLKADMEMYYFPCNEPRMLQELERLLSM